MPLLPAKTAAEVEASSQTLLIGSSRSTLSADGDLDADEIDSDSQHVTGSS